MLPLARVSFLALIASLASCKHAGEYVWVDQYAGVKRADPVYEVAPGDLVAVRVLGHDDLSTRAKVRADGRISIPYLDDVEVAGQPPAQIAEKIRRDFLQIVAHPVVTVTVDEPRPFTVPVTGEVTRPGVYALDTPAGVLQALASAGGLTQYAHEDQIYVLRPSEGTLPVRIRFRYEALAHAEGRSGTFQLQRNDIVVVE